MTPLPTNLASSVPAGAGWSAETAARYTRSLRAPLLVLGPLLAMALVDSVRRVPAPAPDRIGGHAARLDSRLDPNTAPWWELTFLPLVGESLARRIVAYRAAQAGPSPAPAVTAPVAASTAAVTAGALAGANTRALAEDPAGPDEPGSSPRPRKSFRCAADLDAVPGIGPSIVARIEPFLRFD